MQKSRMTLKFLAQVTRTGAVVRFGSWGRPRDCGGQEMRLGSVLEM
jgi:hypothetical protein